MNVDRVRETVVEMETLIKWAAYRVHIQDELTNEERVRLHVIFLACKNLLKGMK